MRSHQISGADLNGLDLSKALSLKDGFDRFLSRLQPNHEQTFRQCLDPNGIYERNPRLFGLLQTELERLFGLSQMELERKHYVDRYQVAAEVQIFRPFIDQCEKGIYLVFGRPLKYTSPEELIPAHVLSHMSVFEFRHSAVEPYRRPNDPFDRFVCVRVLEFAAAIAHLPQEQKIIRMLSVLRLHPSETGASISETARRLESDWKKFGFPTQSIPAFEKAVRRAVSKVVRATGD
jgi:hypothetical protein